MHIFCRIGLHRWEWAWHTRRHNHSLRRDEITICRCARRCDRYPDWMIVDISEIRRR